MARHAVHKLYLHASRIFVREYFNSHKIPVRFINTTNLLAKTKQQFATDIILKDMYFDQERKDKETFHDLIEIFKRKNLKTGHVEFIYAAMKRMEEYGVHEDLETYKKLIDIMPKGKMRITNSWLELGGYYPKHQMCIVELTVLMEQHRVIPDRDMGELLISIFGAKSRPYARYLRMIYWMPKLKYSSPWPAPEPRPQTQIEIARLSIERMTSVDVESEVKIYQSTEDKLATEDTWIVSGQSPIQRKLLQYHPKNHPIYIEGGFRMYLPRKDAMTYFILRADLPTTRRRKTLRDPDDIDCLKLPFFDVPTPDDLIPDFSVHEQKDGIIYGIASTGTLSESSLLSWIRILEKNGNSRLRDLPIIFRNSSPVGNVQPTHQIEDGKTNSTKNSDK